MRIRESKATAPSALAPRLAIFTVAAAVTTVALEGPAWALQGGEETDLPVLLDKRYGADGRQQASLMFTTAVITKLVQDAGVVGTYQYNFNDLLGVGLTAGYFFGSETGVTAAIRAEDPDPGCIDGRPECVPLSDLYQMQWMASADIMFVPLYGKISFASELNPSFQIYLIAGAGAGGVRTPNPAGGSVTSVTFIGNFGLGMRFNILDSLGLRVEFRDYFYPDPANGVGGLTWNPHMQAGVEFTFGGEG